MTSLPHDIILLLRAWSRNGWERRSNMPHDIVATWHHCHMTSFCYLELDPGMVGKGVLTCHMTSLPHDIILQTSFCGMCARGRVGVDPRLRTSIVRRSNLQPKKKKRLHHGLAPAIEGFELTIKMTRRAWSSSAFCLGFSWGLDMDILHESSTRRRLLTHLSGLKNTKISSLVDHCDRRSPTTELKNLKLSRTNVCGHEKNSQESVLWSKTSAKCQRKAQKIHERFGALTVRYPRAFAIVS